MANQQHLEILGRGVRTWNEWRQEDLQRGHLLRVDLNGAALIGANLSRANLREVDLLGANLRSANLARADLFGADLAKANLQNADLTSANLARTTLYSAKLNSAILNRSNLQDADMRTAELRHADLTKARLRRTNLSSADLSEASLRRASLGRANFTRATLSGADLSDADLFETVFASVDLQEAKGLLSCKHNGPSVVDHRTLELSRNLPLQFLRGCGLPDTLIEYLPSLFNDPLQFYSCFISYSSKDQDFADRLHADLQDNGVRCWFAPQDLQGGQKLHEQIDEAIRVYDRLLLILSHHSMDSEWVRTEISHARKKERSQKARVLFPISLVEFDAIKAWECFDSDIGKDSAKEIREFYIPEFSDWKNDHDAYQRELGRLLRDLGVQSGRYR